MRLLFISQIVPGGYTVWKQCFDIPP